MGDLLSAERRKQRFWSWHASTYDSVWDSPWTEQLAHLIAMHSEPHEALPTVEVGCGTALVADRLRTDGHRVIGVDLSLEMARIADTTGRVDTAVVADGARLPLQDGCAGTVVLPNVLHVAHDARAVLDEALRIADDDATIIMSWPLDAIHPRTVARAERRWGRSRPASARANALRFAVGVTSRFAGVRRLRHRELNTLVTTALAERDTTITSFDVERIQHVVTIRLGRRLQS